MGTGRKQTSFETPSNSKGKTNNDGTILKRSQYKNNQVFLAKVFVSAQTKTLDTPPGRE